MNVPLVDLTRAYRPIEAEVVRAVTEVLHSQQMILGPTVERFEKMTFWQSAPGFALTGLVSLCLIAYSAIVLSTVGFNPFIYFRF